MSRLLVPTAVLFCACDPALEPDAVCTDPDTEIAGESTTSRTLQRACGPYTLVSLASFTGEGVVLTLEEGVEVLAEGGARLTVDGGAQLVAGPDVRFAAADGPWEGIVLGDVSVRPSVTHELRGVTVADAAGSAIDVGAAALALWGDGALLEDVRIERPLDVGIQVYREGSWLAPGSRDIVVDEAGGYPLRMDVQNLPTLPADQDLSSVDPDRDRILLFSGNEGLVRDDLVWPEQRLPIEVGTWIEVGSDAGPGSLTLPSTGTILFRSSAGIRVNAGTLVAAGEDPSCADDPAACTLVLAAAVEAQPWASLVFPSTASGSGGSRVENVLLAEGGNNEAMVTIISPSAPGNEGDCGPTTSVTGCWFEADGPCLSATDSSNPYASDNSFHGCAADVRCD